MIRDDLKTNFLKPFVCIYGKRKNWYDYDQVILWRSVLIWNMGIYKHRWSLLHRYTVICLHMTLLSNNIGADKAWWKSLVLDFCHLMRWAVSQYLILALEMENHFQDANIGMFRPHRSNYYSWIFFFVHHDNYLVCLYQICKSCKMVCSWHMLGSQPPVIHHN